jgi:hypothetical protein
VAIAYVDPSKGSPTAYKTSPACGAYDTLVVHVRLFFLVASPATLITFALLLVFLPASSAYNTFYSLYDVT